MYSLKDFDADLAYSSFPYFARHVGKEVMESEELRQDETFVFKPFHLDWAQNMQELKRYLLVAFRCSMKSTLLRLRAMWKGYRLLRGEDNPEYELLYLSYNDKLAAKHTARLNRYMKNSPIFSDCRWGTDAESVIKMTLPNGKRFTVFPGGIFAAQRGQRPDEVFLDDILGDVTDPNHVIEPLMIEKVTRIVFESIQYMPRPKGAVVGAGTPQTDNDIFAAGEKSVEWTVDRLPVEDVNGHSVMPEVFPDDVLKARRGEEGTKEWLAYQKEMMVRPLKYVFRTFLPKGLIEACIRPEQPIGRPEISVGGLDMGKRKHPGHLVFLAPDKGRLRQVFTKWYDGCDYRFMVADASRYAEYFNCELMGVDNTRADFEGFYEQGYVLLSDKDEEGAVIQETVETVKVHYSMQPKTITRPLKWQMGQRMHNAMTGGKLILLPDTRQKNQLLLVDQELKAAETSEGHAEPFTTLGFAIQCAHEMGFLHDEMPEKEPEKLTEEQIVYNAFMAAAERAQGEHRVPGVVYT